MQQHDADNEFLPHVVPMEEVQVRMVLCAVEVQVDAIKQKNEENPVIVYATTYCPFCAGVKGLFDKLGVPFKAIDLDTIVEGDDIRDALAELTESHTVPQVFIGGEFIGGCDDTMQLNSSGKLTEKLEAAGVAAKA
eukprot:jgi/Astpho2/3850/Aster-x1178